MSAQLEDRDPVEEGTLPIGIRRDVPLPDGSGSAAAGGTILEKALDEGPRLVAQVTARPGVQDEVGEGSRHLVAF